MKRNIIIIKSFMVSICICIIAEMIGPLKLTIFGVPITIMTLIWAILLGICCSPKIIGKVMVSFQKIISEKEIKIAPYLLSLTLYPLSIMFGINAGPKIGVVLEAGPALLLQEFGNVATMLIALPVGVMLGLGRSSIGATFSLCRDTALGIIGDKYGLNSPEGIGTLGVYICGSIFGTLFYSILAPVGLKLGFHPFSLAMASGMGSASMMTAATSALANLVPQSMQAEVLAYSATSGLLTAVDGVYMEMFVALPLAIKYYDKVSKWWEKKNEK